MKARVMPGTWTLPDDGIIDLIAVELAARGIRPVALTPAERQLAAARILARGGTSSLVARRLHLSGSAARALTTRARERAAADAKLRNRADARDRRDHGVRIARQAEDAGARP